jgi:hypothetical protein
MSTWQDNHLQGLAPGLLKRIQETENEIEWIRSAPVPWSRSSLPGGVIGSTRGSGPRSEGSLPSSGSYALRRPRASQGVQP